MNHGYSNTLETRLRMNPNEFTIQWTANHMLTMPPRALFHITRPGVKTITGTET